MDFSVEIDSMAPSNQSKMRQAAEKNVLAYITALTYEQNPRQWMLERGLTLTPLVPAIIDPDDPAAQTCGVMADFNNENVAIMNANFLAQMSGECYLGVYRAFE